MPTCVWVRKLMVINRSTLRLFFVISCLAFPPIAADSWAADDEISTVQTDEVSIFEMKRWSPYAAGFGIGVLSWLVFLLSDNTLGASNAYARTAGMIERLVRGREVEQRAYYKENPLEKRILHMGEFGKITLPELLNAKPWPVILRVSAIIAVFLLILELAGA